MSLIELLPSVRKLPALDKLRLMQILSEELDSNEDIYPLQPNKIYYLPTPYNSFGVGRLLMAEMAENVGV